MADWFADKSPAFAKRAGRAAVTAGELLAKHREAWEEIKSGIRRWHVRGTPDLLIHRISFEQVEILHVRHERQDGPNDL